MSKQSFFAYVICAFAISINSAGAGVMTWEDYTKTAGQSWFKIYLAGVGEGLLWMDTRIQIKQGTPRLLCVPDKLGLTHDNYTQLFDNYLKSEILKGRKSHYKYIVSESVMLHALQEAFPCVTR